MALPSVLALTLSPLWPAWCAFATLLTPHFWLGVAAAVLLVRAAEARARTRAARSAAVPVLAECTPPTLKQLKLSASLGDVPSWVSYPDFERTNWINQLLKKMWPFIGESAHARARARVHAGLLAGASRKGARAGRMLPSLLN